MGWNSADEIVEPVIVELDRLVEAGDIGKVQASKVLRPLIKACQERDWDTEEETLGLWWHRTWVVVAFAECGVVDSFRAAPPSFVNTTSPSICGAKRRFYAAQAGGAVILECALRKGHPGAHFDEDFDAKWPQI